MPLRINGEGTPVKHQFILTAHLINVEDGHCLRPGHAGDLSDPLRLLALMEGRSIQIDEYLRTGLLCFGRGLLMPDILTNGQTKLDTSQRHDTGRCARVKIAFLVEYLIVR